MQPLPRMTLSDAVKRCELEAQVKFGDQLLRTFPDWHSSRFEPKRSIYLVMLSADVGRLDLFQTANVYCYVDPVDRDVDYYRVAGLKSRSIFSLKKLKDIFD